MSGGRKAEAVSAFEDAVTGYLERNPDDLLGSWAMPHAECPRVCLSGTDGGKRKAKRKSVARLKVKR